MSVNVSMSTRLRDFWRFRLFLIFIHCGLWIKIHSSQSTPVDCLSFLQIRQNWSEIDFSNYYPFSTWSSFEDLFGLRLEHDTLLLRYRSINQCANLSMIVSGQFVPFFPKKRRNLNDLFHYQTIYKLSIQRKRVYRKGNQAFYLIARLLGITTEYGVPKIKSNGLFCLFSFRVFMFFLIFCINCR